MKKICFFALLISLFILTLSGEVKLYASFYNEFGIGYLDTDGYIGTNSGNLYYSDINAIYLKLKGKPSRFFDVIGEFGFSVKYPEYKWEINPLMSYDASTNGYFVKDAVDFFDINRLNIKLHLWKFNILFGRFLPRWGVNYVFRPTDGFQSETFLKDEVVNKGLDGLDVKFFLSDLIYFELLTIPNMNIEDSIIGGNFSFHFFTVDAKVIAKHNFQNENTIIGVNFKADIAQMFTIFGEAIYSFYDDEFDIFYEPYIKIAGGFDFSIYRVIFIEEFCYDESGALDIEDYLNLENRSFLGRFYNFMDVHYFSDFFSAGIQGLLNIGDLSFMLSPYISFQIFNGVSFSASFYIFNGRSGSEFSEKRVGRFLSSVYIKVRF